MNSKTVDGETLTPLQKKILVDYQKSTRKYRVHNKNAHLTIRKGLLDWLAQPVRRERYKLEEMEPHEQVAIIDGIVAYMQDKRTKKSAETRAATKEQEKIDAKKNQQTTFGF
jgi:hypothetical protein